MDTLELRRRGRGQAHGVAGVSPYGCATRGAMGADSPRHSTSRAPDGGNDVVIDSSEVNKAGGALQHSKTFLCSKSGAA